MQREVETYPGVDINFTFRGKHKVAQLTLGENSRMVFYPSTPSDSRRGIKNKLQDLRRVLREIGAEKA